MAAFLGFFFFLILFLFFSLVVFGIRVLRLLFGGFCTKRAPKTEHTTVKDERRQRIREQMKENSEYVEFEEIPDKMSAE